MTWIAVLPFHCNTCIFVVCLQAEQVCMWHFDWSSEFIYILLLVMNIKMDGTFLFYLSIFWMLVHLTKIRYKRVVPFVIFPPTSWAMFCLSLIIVKIGNVTDQHIYSCNYCCLVSFTFMQLYRISTQVKFILFQLFSAPQTVWIYVQSHTGRRGDWNRCKYW